jgi:hypothetical protein
MRGEPAQVFELNRVCPEVGGEVTQSGQPQSNRG